MIAPAAQDQKDLTGLSIPQIVEMATEKWAALTGVSLDANRWSMRDYDIKTMNDAMAEAMKLDPTGTTTYLLLECFLREYLTDKTMTAAQIMKNYAATTEFLRKAEELFSIVQSEAATEMAANFRARVVRGVAHYGADRPDVIKMIEDPDALTFLRRDALHSLNSLKPYQFLAGEPGQGVAQVIEHVYQAWNINDLLIGLRDMPVGGIAVVLLRDPAHPERSYFCFAMRNGGNVFIFTDKTKPAYPGQADVLKGGRSVGRDFMKKTWENHFPYQLIPKHFNEKGDVIFDEETAPVMAGVNLVPLMRIRDLPDFQVIWLTMMLTLVAEKFWNQKWQAPALSYTGEMIRNRQALVTGRDGAQLPAAAGYQQICLEDLKVEDLTHDEISKQVRRGASGVNQWMEDRYRHLVPAAVVNQWRKDSGLDLLLPRMPDPQKRGSKALYPVNADGVIEFRDDGRIANWDKPEGYDLQTFSPTEFGTEAELKADRTWIGRYNMARYIQKCADDEYETRKVEVADWYLDAIRKNEKAIMDMIAARWMPGDDKKFRKSQRLMFRPSNSKYWGYEQYSRNFIGVHDSRKSTILCAVTGAAPSYRAYINPRTAQDLADLCGMDVVDLPDVLQNWERDQEYFGNHRLERLDPMDYNLHDPWMKLDLKLNVYLSKRGAKALGIEAPEYED